MDTLGALALATEPPTDHLMHRSPVGRRFAILISVDCAVAYLDSVLFKFFNVLSRNFTHHGLELYCL